MNSVAALPCES